MRNYRLYLAVTGIIVGVTQGVASISNMISANRAEPSSDATLTLCLISPLVGAVCAFFLARDLERSKLRWGIASLFIPVIPIFIISALALKESWKEWRWRKQLSRTTAPKVQTTSLAARLLSRNLPDRQAAIKEVYARTEQGDPSGLAALEEALVSLAGYPNLDLYRTTGRLDSFGRQRAELAPDSLISLAETGKLLESPRLTQMFIHQLATTGQADRVLKRITEIGGKALHAYQLLGVDIQVYAELRRKGISGLPK